MMDFDSYHTPDGETLLRSAVDRFVVDADASRVRRTELVAAALFFLAAATIAVLVHPVRSLSLSTVAIVVPAYLIAARVRFPVGSAWTSPTQLVFVPMLFLLPTSIVPLLVVWCGLLNLWPDLLERRLTLSRVAARCADSMYSLGPVLVLVLAHTERFSWDRWPVLLLAFAAQVVCDGGAGLARTWFAERVIPSRQPQMLWLYATDFCLACAGLLVAASAVKRPGLVLLALPMIALVGLFARERQQRVDHSLELSSAYRGTAMLLSDVIEADDEYTGIHSRQVVDMALAVADRLGLSPQQRVTVEFGALLHDVGKIRVPIEIIRKRGPLTDDEWAIMREHTIAGQEMLLKVGGTLAGVGSIVRSSHERFDGRGYPDGLAGEQIPIESRIITVCDAFNAMTTDRPYRNGMPRAQAVAEVRSCSGSQFDPVVAAALILELGLV